jgi:predicted nuclease with TOPRIM domain
MEARITRLEARADKVADNLTDVRVELATLKERVAHLPSKDFIVRALATSVAILGGMFMLADRLKALLGI